MWEYKARDPEDPVPCRYALALRETAQEIFARITETTTLDTFARCQQSLLARYWELAERVQQDWAHFPTPRTGRHWCLRREYEQAYQKLKILSLTRTPPPAPPPPRPQPRSDAELRERLKEYVTERTTETFFGQEQEEEGEEEEPQ